MDGVGREVHHRNDTVVSRLADQRHQAVLGVVADLGHRAAPLPRRQGRVVVAQRREAAVEPGESVGLVTGNRIAVEEGERMVVADLLPGVDQRQAARHDEGEDGHDLAGGAHAGELRAVPRILVVVGGEGQPHGRTGIAPAVGIDVVAQRRDADPLLRHVVHQVVHLPRIAGVEGSPVEKVGLLGFGQHEQIGLHPPQALRRLVPEFDRNQHRHVAAEAVHAVFADPELHGVALRAPHFAFGIVEFGRVGPVPRHGGRSRSVALVPRSGLFGHPAGVARRMVGDPVQQHLHTQPVRLGDEGVEIFHRPQTGIDRTIVADRIIGAERAFAPLDADRIDGHQPHGVDAHVAQEAQFRGRGAQRAFGRQLAHVHFIEHGLITPFGM